jgi:uncharacterized protein (TIGR00369 family)
VKGIVMPVRMRQYLARMDWTNAMPFGALLGIEAVSADAAEVHLRLAWREDLCTAGGLMHGGALMALADSAAGVCAFLNLPDGAAGTATISSSTSFLRPVRDGYAEAISRPLSIGRNVIAVDTEVVDANGRAVARVMQSQAVLR